MICIQFDLFQSWREGSWEPNLFGSFGAGGSWFFGYDGLSKKILSGGEILEVWKVCDGVDTTVFKLIFIAVQGFYVGQRSALAPSRTDSRV